MKKRKELDALLLTNMNGKKMSKGNSSGKEGHELLRNEASWDSNSTENDEFFSPPRRLSIRKPHKWRVCATGLQLCVFVVMVACIVVTGGLVWMHLDLKQDLDELRLRIAKVESELQTSTEQASTVSTLQVNIEKLMKLPAQISSVNRQIERLNLTNSRLQAKVKEVRDEIKALPTISIEGLQQSTAQIGSTMQSVQGLQGQHTQQIDTLTSSLNQLQASLTELQSEVSKQYQTESTDHHEAADPTAATNGLSLSKDIQSLQEGQKNVSQELVKMNTTVASIQLWRQDLMPRIRTLESANHSSEASADGSLTEKLAKLQSQVNSLLSNVNSPAPPVESGDKTQGPIASDTATEWRQEIVSEIQTLQKRVDKLNPQDLNNNLLNVNTTQGIQHQIERALNVFKAENLKSVDDVWNKLYQQHSAITDVQQDVDNLQVRVQDLENKEGKSPPPSSSKLSSAGSSTSATTAEPSTTADLQPITIEGISSVDDLTMKFFIWDKNSDERLSYGELKDFLGPNAPPEEQFLRYDRDKDGKLNLAEMRTALGFH